MTKTPDFTAGGVDFYAFPGWGCFYGARGATVLVVTMNSDGSPDLYDGQPNVAEVCDWDALSRLPDIPLSASTRKPHNLDAGYVAELRTGAELPDGRRDFVTIYRASEAEMESDPATPWAVVCQRHGTLVCTESLRAARSTMKSGSREFCDCCRGNCAATTYGPCVDCGRAVA